jgi:hypothetical protein
MKYFGDIPADHLELVEELKELENWFIQYGGGVPLLEVAKGMVCMGCDYYEMGMDEEGERLFLTAEKYCPGYFTAPVLVHIIKDREFCYLITRAKETPALELMLSLGFQDE